MFNSWIFCTNYLRIVAWMSHANNTTIVDCMMELKLPPIELKLLLLVLKGTGNVRILTVSRVNDLIWYLRLEMLPPNGLRFWIRLLCLSLNKRQQSVSQTDIQCGARALLVGWNLNLWLVEKWKCIWEPGSDDLGQMD